MDLDVQQAQLRICLQSDILKWFDNQVKEDTPICGDEGCLDMIQKWFEEKYSLLWRRFDLFTSSQAVGQDWIEWANEIVALGTEAEIEKMKTDDILVMKLITGTKDCQLREKLLEQKEEVSVKKCFAVAKHYLLAKAGSEHFGSSANIKALKSQLTGLQKTKNINSNFRCLKPATTVIKKDIMPSGVLGLPTGQKLLLQLKGSSRTCHLKRKTLAM